MYISSVCGQIWLSLSNSVAVAWEIDCGWQIKRENDKHNFLCAQQSAVQISVQIFLAMVAFWVRESVNFEFVAQQGPSSAPFCRDKILEASGKLHLGKQDWCQPGWFPMKCLFGPYDLPVLQAARLWIESASRDSQGHQIQVSWWVQLKLKSSAQRTAVLAASNAESFQAVSWTL